LVDFLISFGVGVGVLLVLFFANYWCIPILMAWRYQTEHRHVGMFGQLGCGTTGWILWMLFNVRELYAVITGGYFLWIPLLAAFVG